jgi:hypothetical protein
LWVVRGCLTPLYGMSLPRWFVYYWLVGCGNAAHRLANWVSRV